MSNTNQKISCRAALLYEVGAPQVIENVLIDPPTGDQVRVKIVAAGICASDAILAWAKRSVRLEELPIVLGHESAGIVESVGEGVHSLEAGDCVLTNSMPQCHNCSYCANATNNFCAHENIFRLNKIPNKKLPNGKAVFGLNALGVFSEYILVKACQVEKIDSRVNLETASVISCSVVTGFYAATHQANVQPGSTAAVWGLGAVGMNALVGCRFAGAKNIIGIDINNSKREFAVSFGGCTEFINPNQLNGQPINVYLKKKYGGIDYVIECTGLPDVIELAFKSLTPFGTLALVGVGPPDCSLTFPAFDFIAGRKIIGGIYGNKQMKQGFPEMVNMYLSGQYDIERLITHKFRLEQVNEAFQLLREGNCIRSIIVFD